MSLCAQRYGRQLVGLIPEIDACPFMEHIVERMTMLNASASDADCARYQRMVLLRAACCLWGLSLFVKGINIAVLLNAPGRSHPTLFSIPATLNTTTGLLTWCQYRHNLAFQTEELISQWPATQIGPIAISLLS